MALSAKYHYVGFVVIGGIAVLVMSIFGWTGTLFAYCPIEGSPSDSPAALFET